MKRGSHSHNTTDKISLTLPTDQLSRLEALRHLGHGASVSHLVRAAIDEWLANHTVWHEGAETELGLGLEVLQ